MGFDAAFTCVAFGIVLGAFGALGIWFQDQRPKGSRKARVYLSGAITGHEEDARKYFDEAEAIVRGVFPGCSVFNPTHLPKLNSWESYMEICRAVLRGWSTHFVVIVNPYLCESRGAAEEIRIAYEGRIATYHLEDSKITLTDKYTEPVVPWRCAR